MQRGAPTYTNRLARAVCGGVLAATAASLPACHRPPAQPKRNVIIVLSDALRAANLPMYGYPRNTAPRLSELAREGITFDMHLAHYPGTTVSVSQLHTGRLMAPLLIGYKNIAVPVRAIPPDLLILPQAFEKAGYRTGIISSHYWFRDQSRQNRLLQYFSSKAIIAATGDQPYAFFENLWPALTAFLDASRADQRPFFLYLHTLDTHGPNAYHAGFDQYRAAADWPEAYNLYDSEILYTDHWVGKLVDALRERDLLDSTILVFTADHGEEFNEMGPEKWNAFHGPHVRRVLMHVPLIMRIPGDPSPGRRYSGLTRHIDLAPTLLRLAVPQFNMQPYRVDGEDLSHELSSGSTGSGTQRTSFAYTPRYWAIYQRDVEVHYDQWTNTYSPLLRPVPDAHNYPMLQPVEDPERRAALIEQLAHEYVTRTREYLDLPENPSLPNPALVGFMPPVGWTSGAPPTFENLPDDNRWGLAASSLECQPAEHPEPLTLITPWVSGTYRVSVMLSQPAARAGYRNEFTLRFPDDGDVPPHDGDLPIHLRGADAQGSQLDAGVHTLGRQLAVQISDPQGGVAIVGLKLERVGNSSQPQVDNEIKEHLRVLGYGE
jgi:arylsulfatase A-like enzyme